MSHEHVVLVVIVTFALSLAAIIWMGVVLGRMLKEAQRFTRLVAGLVVQESEKVQALVRDIRTS